MSEGNSRSVWYHKHQLGRSPMKPIYLVQRATIKVPLAFDKSTLTDSVRFDYMGSSEFEYGALPASLRRLQSNQKAITTFVAPIYDKKGRHLRILSYLSKEDINLYVGQLCLLRKVVFAQRNVQNSLNCLLCTTKPTSGGTLRMM